jgi:hypothetical protein
MIRRAAFPLVMLLLAPIPPLAAQEPATRPAAARPDAQNAPTAQEVRSDLERLLDQYGPALPRVLKLDPSLLSNEAYLQPYPALRQFLSQHPEVTHNASYYFASYSTGTSDDRDYRLPGDRTYEMWNEVLDGAAIVFVFSAIVSGLVWLIKTGIDHRRWMRLSKVQTEVHNKLLDRLTSNDELLAYIQTPAGKRFLESAPMQAEPPRAVTAPLSRILWSAQIGAVLAVAGIGIEIVAARAIDEVAQPLAAVGVFVIAIGIGFGVSALIAWTISRRLGLLPGAASTAVDLNG